MNLRLITVVAVLLFAACESDGDGAQPAPVVGAGPGPVLTDLPGDPKPGQE